MTTSASANRVFLLSPARCDGRRARMVLNANATFDLQFPVVVKPARSVADAGSTRVKLGASHAHDPATLGTVVGLQIVSAIAACIAPTIYATRVSPTVALATQ